MKKAYSAPDILFESFTLSTHIAGDCEPPYVNATEGACGVPGTGGVMLFTVGLGDCTSPGPDTYETNDGFCYHNPSDDKNLFNS